MDIPDQLYRRLKAQSASRGTSVRQVLLLLIEEWLGAGTAQGTTADDAAATLSNQEKVARLRAFLDETADEIARAPEPTPLNELLEQGRGRLEPGP